MTTNQRSGSLQFCRTRFTLLDSSGKPDPGAESIIVTKDAINLGWKVNLKAGAKFSQENGCGETCLTFQDDDEIESVDLTTTLCILDDELLELVAGWTLVMDELDATVVRGSAMPDVGVKLGRRVGVEGWTKAWDGDQPAIDVDGSSVLYHRWVFPSTSWVIGDGTLENNPLAVPLTGHGRSNSQWGDGPANDLPWGKYVTPMGHFIDKNALPDPTDGYATLVAS